MSSKDKLDTKKSVERLQRESGQKNIMSKDKFKPGYKWRILAKNSLFKKENSIKALQSEVSFSNFVFPSYFDELVIDDWLHLEMMDENSYWMRIGNYRIDIKFDRDIKDPIISIEEED
jgi:hypothetical protein